MIKPRCNFEGECFGKEYGYGINTISVYCSCLQNTEFSGKCPFQKPEMEVTNGKLYPYIPPVPDDGRKVGKS